MRLKHPLVVRVSDLQKVFAGLGTGFAHHLLARSKLGEKGVDTAKKLNK